MGTLYCSDNLAILKRYTKGDSVDYIYFNSPCNPAKNDNRSFHETEPAI